MKYLVLIADIDEFNPCKASLGNLVEKEYKIKFQLTNGQPQIIYDEIESEEVGD